MGSGRSPRAPLTRSIGLNPKVALDGDIGRSNVVSKLILTGMALKEAIELDIATMKS